MTLEVCDVLVGEDVWDGKDVKSKLFLVPECRGWSDGMKLPFDSLTSQRC